MAPRPRKNSTITREPMLFSPEELAPRESAGEICRDDEVLPEEWARILPPEIADEHLRRVREERAAGITVYPPPGQIFNALRLTPPDAVRAVILGQDPYHGPGEAMGIAFAVPESCTKLPPSLRNILRELRDDLGVDCSSDLTRWARQGVLMLNTTLSVRKDLPFSHKNLGWNKLTDAVISAVSNSTKPVAFILWGKPAQSKLPLIDQTRHAVFQSAHPSPLSASRGFFGSKPFSKTNAWLQNMNQDTIEW